MDRPVKRRVLAAMPSLPPTDPMERTAASTVGVAAQQAGIDVLHHDRHFERLGAVLEVRSLWIATPTD